MSPVSLAKSNLILTPLVLLALLLLCGGCGGSRDAKLTAAEAVVNPVEVPLDKPITSVSVNPTDDTKADILQVTIFFKIDQSDKLVFDSRFASRKNEARERVANVLSLATLDEKKDPLLESIKGKILAAINDLLGAEYVKEIIATDVSFGTFQN